MGGGRPSEALRLINAIPRLVSHRWCISTKFNWITHHSTLHKLSQHHIESSSHAYNAVHLEWFRFISLFVWKWKWSINFVRLQGTSSNAIWMKSSQTLKQQQVQFKRKIRNIFYVEAIIKQVSKIISSNFSLF